MKAGRVSPWAALDGVAIAVGFWLAAPLPVAMAGGTYDDLLFVRLANHILAGEWLGPFGPLTLAKGPFYPLFLAACAAIGLPVQAATEAVYLAGAFVLSRAAGDLAGRRWMATFCLAALAINPACFDWSATVLMREPLYGGLMLLVLALAARVFLCGGGVGSALALGVAAACFWLTREEGSLLALPIAIMSGWYFRTFLAAALARLRRRGAAPVAWPGMIQSLVAGGTALGLVLAVCATNQVMYGVFRSNDFQSGPFARAYGALARVTPDHWQRLVPIPRDARMRAYQASPAARELQPSLENAANLFSVDVECGSTPRPACHDIPGASFMWALRNAVAAAGHYGAARDADRFYRRLAAEINGACDRGALRCGRRRDGYLPAFDAGYARPLVAGLWQAAVDVAWLGRAGPLAAPSSVQGPDAAAYENLAFGTTISPPASFIGAAGWSIAGAFSSPDPAVTIAVVGGAAGAVQSDLRLLADPAANPYLHRSTGLAQVFSFDVRCAPGDCRLQLQDGARVLGAWPLAGLHRAIVMDRPEAVLYIDFATALPALTTADRPNMRSIVMRGISLLLPYVTGMGALPAVAWLIWRTALAIGHRRADPLLVLLWALGVAVLLRVALLGLLDATSIGLQFRYESPVLGIWIGFLAVLGAGIIREAGGHEAMSPGPPGFY